MKGTTHDWQAVVDNVLKFGYHLGSSDGGGDVDTYQARSAKKGGFVVRRDIWFKRGIAVKATVLILANGEAVARFVCEGRRPELIERVYYGGHLFMCQRTL